MIEFALIGMDSAACAVAAEGDVGDGQGVVEGGIAQEVVVVFGEGGIEGLGGPGVELFGAVGVVGITEREPLVFEALGVEIAGTEIVGLVPEAALDLNAEYFSRLENFDVDAVIEHRMKARQPGTRTRD